MSQITERYAGFFAHMSKNGAFEQSKSLEFLMGNGRVPTNF